MLAICWCSHLKTNQYSSGLEQYSSGQWPKLSVQYCILKTWQWLAHSRNRNVSWINAIMCWKILFFLLWSCWNILPLYSCFTGKQHTAQEHSQFLLCKSSGPSYLRILLSHYFWLVAVHLIHFSDQETMTAAKSCLIKENPQAFGRVSDKCFCDNLILKVEITS